MISFSLASVEKPELKSYALFGGYNASEVVGGAKGIKFFPIYPNILDNWVLKGEGVWYDGKALFDEEADYPAVIDTGSSDLSVPKQVFKNLKKEWEKVLPDLNCLSICYVPHPCSKI